MLYINPVRASMHMVGCQHSRITRCARVVLNLMAACILAEAVVLIMFGKCVFGKTWPAIT
jgi:hypothetical protein